MPQLRDSSAGCKRESALYEKRAARFGAALRTSEAVTLRCEDGKFDDRIDLFSSVG